MNIAFVGCGFVFDIYMRTIKAHPELNIAGVYDIIPERSHAVGRYYGFYVYESFQALLDDEKVDAVINLTNIGSHFDVSKKSLEAGKHVYSEKPLTPNMEDSRKLFEIAKLHNVRLYSGPCNIFSDTVRTMFKAVRDGAIGQPLLIYAELDDNPIQMMNFESVKSPTGASWPLVEEIREGCTYEHLGYHLVWICGLLGPAVSVTAVSNELIKDKAAAVPGLSGTPDYSVALLSFANGATARITCSVVAPRDHRMRIIGQEGEIMGDSYRHYRSPVFVERYSKASLNARKFQTLRASPFLGRLFGIGGRKVPLVTNAKSDAVRKNQQIRPSLRQRMFEWIRRREVYAQDKFIGISEMAREISEGQPQFLSPDFILHINEVTLFVQGAGAAGLTHRPTTTFSPLGPVPGTLSGSPDYRQIARPGLLESLLGR